MYKTLYNGYSNNCCAYCTLHRCSITVKQMRKKECLKKQCYHLIKNEGHAIWHQRECKKQQRKERKQSINAMAAAVQMQY